MKPVILLLLSSLLAGNAQAALFVVDSNLDDPDQVPGDGACDSTRGTSCTLRAAIEEADALAGPDTIEFSIGASSIVPLTPLPEINDDLVIDGTTSPDYAPSGDAALEAPPAIYLDGLFLSGSTVDGLSARGTSADPIRVQIRGLGIVRFPRYGIDVTSADTAWIEGNWIGIERTAESTTTGNGSHGLLLSACSDCIVGSIEATLLGVTDVLGRGNAIGNNGGDGILSGFGTGNVFGGNQIGQLPSEPAGSFHTGANAGRGMSLLDSGDTVGQLVGDAQTRNSISFNGGDGLYVGGPATRVEFNQIWLNEGDGIRVLGDDASVLSNSLRYNTGQGLRIGSAGAAADGAVVTGNSSSENDGRGIYLENGSGALVEANSVYLNGNDGVRIDGDANLLRSNRIGIRGTSGLAGNAFNGVVVGGDDNDIIDNEILDTPGDGIDISGLRTTVSGNFIGVTRSGFSTGNRTGIRVQPGALVTDILGNVVVSTSGDGMVLAADGVLVCGNRVGRLADGTVLGNALAGIRVLGNGAYIGRYPPAPSACVGGGNRIDRNGSDGIVVEGSGALIAENLIQDNGMGGVFLSGSAAATTVVDNLVAGNNGPGIRIGAATGTGNRVGANFYPQVADIPVDLGDDGPTSNDPGDGDTGANRLMNHPDIVLAVHTTGNQADVTYRVDVAGANATFPLEVEFYLVRSDGTASSYESLGSLSHDAPPLTQETITVLLPEGVDDGAVAAMATDSAGNSSEIGSAVALSALPTGPAVFSDGFED